MEIKTVANLDIDHTATVTKEGKSEDCAKQTGDGASEIETAANLDIDHT